MRLALALVQSAGHISCQQDFDHVPGRSFNRHPHSMGQIDRTDFRAPPAREILNPTRAKVLLRAKARSSPNYGDPMRPVCTRWKGRKLMVPYDIVAIIKVPSDAIIFSITPSSLAPGRPGWDIVDGGHHRPQGSHRGGGGAVTVGKYIAPRTIFRFNIKGFIFNLITVKIHSSLL